MAGTPHILFVDAYDSFSNNITALLATQLQADVRVLPVDAPLSAQQLRRELRHYDAVVCGPGPGTPDCASDIGWMRMVWGVNQKTEGAATEAEAGTDIPALGICLGFQSLVAAHGGRIRRLQGGGLHGMVRRIEHDGRDIFEGSPAFRATLYHSLAADLGQDAVPAADWPRARWQPWAACPDLVPLAWTEAESVSASSSVTTTPPERVLMAVRHRSRPFWGLQYHPESVCTEAASHAVLERWLAAARAWNVAQGRVRLEGEASLLARPAVRPRLLSLQPKLWDGSDDDDSDVNDDNDDSDDNDSDDNDGSDDSNSRSRCAASRRLQWRSLPLPAGMQVPDLAAVLCTPDSAAEPEQIILDSATAGHDNDDDAGMQSPDPAATRGRFSMVALHVDAALRIDYRTGDTFATLRQRASGRNSHVNERRPLHGQSVWQLLAEFHEAQRQQYPCLAAADDSNTPPTPFFGGFMGYVTYEQGLGDLGVAMPAERVRRRQQQHDDGRPDICFVWVTRSLVVDHVAGRVYVQELGASSRAWVDGVVAKLQAAAAAAGPSSCSSLPSFLGALTVRPPDAGVYEAKVRLCQQHIAAGDAYELCLTDQTTLRLPWSSSGSSTSWDLYQMLRRRNPAPFAVYLRLGGATLVSSSPERFVCFAAGPAAAEARLCSSARPLVFSMRPMKGTVRRCAAVATLAQAETLLHVPKEEAENLMIVDLVRHDLHGVCGPGGVEVPALLQVEPHGSVFQMVSVVEGRAKTATTATPTGLDILAASLPPGSMTGAPKKRSCELLCAIEQQHERSLYSGVVGYLCVTGRGDWSVAIRCLFRWDDESGGDNTDNSDNTDVWHIGAGGAVTILSTAAGEREEMFTKLAGPLGIFREAQDGGPQTE